MSFQQKNINIQEAYLNIISEAIKPKFKVGDAVGVGTYTGDGQYIPHDTGKVTKVTKAGDHEVTFDNQKQYTINRGIGKAKDQKPEVSLFNSHGYSVMLGDPRMIIDAEIHKRNTEENEQNGIRRNDMINIIKQISSKQMHSGNFYPFDKTHAEHLKHLIDKHTEQ